MDDILRQEYMYDILRQQYMDGILRQLYMEDITPAIYGRHITPAIYGRLMGMSRGAYMVFVGKPEGRRPLGRPRRRWEDNIKMNLRQVGWGHGLDRSCSGQGQALLNVVINLRVS